MKLAGLLTLDEAAVAGGVSKRTLQRRVAAGLLKPFRQTGLYLAKDVSEAITKTS